MRSLLSTGSLLWLLVFAASALGQSARVSMTASATRVAVGQPFAVEVRADVTGEELDDIELPDFGGLEVIGRRVSRPFSFSFGFGTAGQRAHVQSQVIYNFTLRAVEPGSFSIEPAVATVGGRKFKSQPLTIVASGAAIAPPGGAPAQPAAPDGQAGLSAAPDGSLDGARYDPKLFLRTVVDKAEAYVGEQVTVTVYLYVHGQLQSTPTVTREPTTDGFWVHDLLPVQRSLSAARQEVNGRPFNVYVLRRYAAFPLRPGELVIGAPEVEVGGVTSIFSLFGGAPSASLERRGVDVAVQTKPLPAPPQPDAPSHVGEVSLEASLDPPQAKVGEAVTLKLVAAGTGNLKALKLPDPSIAGVDVLAPEIDDEVSTDLDQLGGKRTFRWLLLARTPGQHRIGPFVVQRFDPERARYHAARSQPLTLRVSGQAASPGAAAAPDRQAPTTSAAADAEGPSFGPVRTESALRRQAAPLHHAPWFWWAVILGPAICVGAHGGKAARARLAEARQRRRGGHGAEAPTRKLAEAERAADRGDAAAAYGAMIAALRKALEQRVGEPVGGLTLPALRRLLESRALPAPQIERIVDVLNRCELARFAPGKPDPRALSSALSQTRGVLDQLSRSPGDRR